MRPSLGLKVRLWSRRAAGAFVCATCVQPPVALGDGDARGVRLVAVGDAAGDGTAVAVDAEPPLSPQALTAATPSSAAAPRRNPRRPTFSSSLGSVKDACSCCWIRRAQLNRDEPKLFAYRRDCYRMCYFFGPLAGVFAPAPFFCCACFLLFWTLF